MEAKEVAKVQDAAHGQELAKEETLLTLTEFMTSVIGQLSTEKKYSAVRTYTSTRNSFTAFAKEEKGEYTPETGRGMSLLENNEELSESGEVTPSEEKPDLSLPSVFTAGRLKAYETWLRGRGREWGTVSTYMRTLQAVYNRYCEPGTVGYNPKMFDGVYTKVESHTKRALDEEQMGTLLAADFEALPKEVRCALAYFLLMFLFRGMPFIDLAYLRKQDLKGDKIVYCRHKTGRQIIVRIPREAKAVFEQFRDQNSASPYLFPILDGKLRDDGELYEQYLQALRRFNKQLQVVAKVLLPDAKLSSYTPRHTWATLAFHHNVSIGIISKALGHSSIKVTETYLKPFEDEKVDIANDELIVTVVRKKNAVKESLNRRQEHFQGVGLLTK